MQSRLKKIRDFKNEKINEHTSLKEGGTQFSIIHPWVSSLKGKWMEFIK
jgi:hypothetical protein